MLRERGYVFETVTTSVSEELEPGILPEVGVKELALRKAEAGVAAWAAAGRSSWDVVLGADTMVVLDACILGKPATAGEAEEMLRRLSGRTHQVLTGVALISGSGQRLAQVVKTIVHFRQLETSEIEDYVAGGEPMDKAGAYGIQGEAQRFVTSIEGSLTNVIGLPMEYLAAQLGAWGIEQTNVVSREVDDELSALERFTGGTAAP